MDPKRSVLRAAIRAITKSSQWKQFLFWKRYKTYSFDGLLFCALTKANNLKTVDSSARELMNSIGDKYVRFYATPGWRLLPLVRPKSIEAVIAGSYGRFGNQIAELACAISLAKALGVKRVVVEEPKPFVAGVHSFEGITVEVRKNAVRLNSLLDIIVKSFAGLSPRIHVAGASCLAWMDNNGTISPTPSAKIYDFIGSIIDWPKTGGLLPAGHLVAHVRSGDVFSHPVNKTYGQLPLAFYQLCIRSQPWKKVWVVAEDTTNPVVNELLGWLASENIDHEFHSKTLEEDIALLSRARHLVASRGTFVASIAATVKHKPRVFFMEQQSLPIDVENSIHVHDRCGEYRSSILRNNWAMSAAQLKLMISYRIECLEIQGGTIN